jgi:glutamine amidotransferase
MIAVIGKQSERVHRIERAFSSLGYTLELADQPEKVLKADRLIFAPSGKFVDCMSELEHLELIKPLQEAAAKKPLLAIGLGLQILFGRGPADQDHPGLGLLDGEVRRLILRSENDEAFPAHHQGFKQVFFTRPHPMILGIAEGSEFYFDHSYVGYPLDRHVVLGLTEFEEGRIPVVLAQRNIFAVQFQPEQSLKLGALLFDFFVHWKP